VLSAALSLVGFAHAGEPPVWVPAIVRQDNSDLLDLELALRAREALARNPALGGMNLVVSVRQRVATLRGTTTATDVEAQARACLKTVSGLTDVRSELHHEEPERQQLAPGAIQLRVPIAERVIIQAPRTQAALVLRHPEDGWAPSPPAASGGAAPQASANLPRKMGNRSQYPSLSEAIDGLRLADQRFHEITADIHGQVVSLKGRVNRFEHVAELAQAIARLPGVERVLLDQVRVDWQP
jgi:osmotically-inducible protein OsmY